MAGVPRHNSTRSRPAGGTSRLPGGRHKRAASHSAFNHRPPPPGARASSCPIVQYRVFSNTRVFRDALQGNARSINTWREMRTDVAFDVADGYYLLFVRNIDRWKDRIGKFAEMKIQFKFSSLDSSTSHPSLIAIKIYGSIANRRRIYLSLSLSRT